MNTTIRLLFAGLLILSSSACGDDGSTPGDTSITVDSGGDTGGGGDGGGGDGGGGDGGGGDGGGGDGGGGDGGGDGAVADGNVPDAADAAAGCVGGTCPTGEECCSGVPYPPEGVCMAMCTMRSDRAAKDDFESVDPDEMLARLAALPISEWSYRDESGSVRHVGPMAQDFHASFQLGSDDRVIHPVDAAGVTMAAIQALAQRVEALEQDNAALRAHAEALEERLAAHR